MHVMGLMVAVASRSPSDRRRTTSLARKSRALHSLFLLFASISAMTSRQVALNPSSSIFEGFEAFFPLLSSGSSRFCEKWQRSRWIFSALYLKVCASPAYSPPARG